MTMLPTDFETNMADILATTPVDIMAVAERLGLPIYASKMDAKVSGMIVRDESTPAGFAIYVDANEAYVRQRFTAAHEIGHFVLHRDRIGNGVTDNHLYRSEQLSNWVEVQANRFAADLLMPYPLIQAAINRGVTTVSALAREFQVSEIAMGIRLGHPT